MEEQIILADALPQIDYRGIEPIKPVDVRVSEPALDAGLGADPTMYLLGGALFFLIIAALEVWQPRSVMSPASRVGVVLMSALGGLCLGLAMFWPSFFGHPLPFEMIGEAPPGFIHKSLVVAMVAGLAAFVGLLQIEKRRSGSSPH